MSGASTTRPDGLRHRFLAAGPTLREEQGAHGISGPDYSALALDLLGDRPRTLLLARDDGRVDARALVTIQEARPDTALLGLYEAREGPRGDLGTREILDRAAEWALGAGCTHLLAPVDGSTWLSYRFRVPDPAGEAGGEPRRFSWEPRHPPQYLERFLMAGFHTALEFETLGLRFPKAGPYRIQDAAHQTRPAAEAAKAAGYRIHSVREWGQEIPWADLHRLTSEAFADNPLFAPIPLSAFRHLYDGALGAAALDYTNWIESPEGHMCAVLFAFRHESEVILKSVAVEPGHRGRHLSTALVHRVLARAATEGLNEVVSALVRTGNTSEFLSRRHLMPGVTTWRHRYAVLGQELVQ